MLREGSERWREAVFHTFRTGKMRTGHNLQTLGYTGLNITILTVIPAFITGISLISPLFLPPTPRGIPMKPNIPDKTDGKGIKLTESH